MISPCGQGVWDPRWLGKHVCVHADVCVLWTGSRALPSACNLFSHVLKYGRLLRWMVDVVT